MAPIHLDPDFLFTVRLTTTERECFFCDETIDPIVHLGEIHVGIPGKESFTLHTECFETLAWSMMNFLVTHRDGIEPEVVHN